MFIHNTWHFVGGDGSQGLFVYVYLALLRNADAPTRVLLPSPKGVLGRLLRKLPHDRAYIAARVLDALRECLIDEARARARAPSNAPALLPE